MNTSVFKITPDVNRFQSLQPSLDFSWESGTLDFKCYPKGPSWQAPQVHVANKRLLRGHFFSLCATAFAVDEHAFTLLRRVLERASEVLLISVESDKYYVIHITGCTDCLDQDHSDFLIDEASQRKVMIKKYVFDALKLTSSLFKLPGWSAIKLAATGIDAPEREFKTLVEQHRLEGLRFEPLWTSSTSI